MNAWMGKSRLPHDFGAKPTLFIHDIVN